MNEEEKNLAVQVWAKIVTTQEHFNELILQVRNHLLTILTAIFGAAAVALIQDFQISIHGLSIDLTTIVLLLGFIILVPFYITEKGYHHLLVGAVTHALAFEQEIRNEVPGIGMTSSISESSHRRIFFVIRESADRIRWFYSILAGIFLGAIALTLLGHNRNSERHSLISIDPATRASNSVGSSAARATSYVPNDPSQGTRALKNFYNVGAYDYLVDEVVCLAERYFKNDLNTGDCGKYIAVFDIDDTALSSWEILNKGDFTWDPQRFRDFVLSGSGRKIEPVLRLFNLIKHSGIPVVFLTSRSEDLRAATKKNLSSEGYNGYAQLIMRPDGDSTSAKVFKDRARSELRSSGRTIVLSIGDHLEDLDDKSSQGNFLLPDPFY